MKYVVRRKGARNDEEVRGAGEKNGRAKVIFSTYQRNGGDENDDYNNETGDWIDVEDPFASSIVNEQTG
jgi:hypothetical protein